MSKSVVYWALLVLANLSFCVGCIRERELGLVMISDATTVGLYETIEFSFDYQSQTKIANPYDKNEIRGELTVQCEKEAPEVHSAFYMVPYKFDLQNQKEVPMVAGPPRWNVRFTPRKLGRYSWTFKLTHANREFVYSGNFNCIESTRNGFVGISSIDPNYLEYSDGSFCYPVGHAVRSPADYRWAGNIKEEVNIVKASEARGVFEFETRFNAMSDNGENFCILWLSPWWCGLEWSPIYEGYEGLGRYNQINAARVDQIIKWAESHDIHLIVYLANHGQFSTYIDPEWFDSPYRNRFDKTLTYPSEFFSDKASLRIYDNVLDYAVARWGSSPSIACWGICTETDWLEPWMGTRCLQAGKNLQTGNGRGPIGIVPDRNSVMTWLKHSSEHIHSRDNYKHIVSTQFAYPESWEQCVHSKELHMILSNAYTTEIKSKQWANQYMTGTTGIVDVIFAFNKYFESFESSKPVLVAEWGGSPQGNDCAMLRTELHAGVWSMAVSKAAGITGFWWWHAIETNNWYTEFKSVANFVADIDRRNKDYSSERLKTWWQLEDVSHDKKIKQFPHPRFKALGLFNDSELYTYVFASEVNNQNSNVEVNARNPENCLPDENCILELPERLLNGSYRLEIWDTLNGEVVEEKIVSVNDKSSRLLDLRMTRVDCALKLRQIR